MPYQETKLGTQIEKELQDYFTGKVQVSPDYNFSQPKLVRRISLFENHIYPTGKFTKAGDYKFWPDIIEPRKAGEVKNIDFDSKNVSIESDRKIDELPTIITNLKLKSYLRDTGQAEEINSAVEEFSGWGNVVWKKVKGGYERCDLKNFYVINQTAEHLGETPVIERHQFNESDLRKKKGIWENISEVIRECKADYYSSTAETQGKDTTIPYYDIYERNGEVCLADLKEYWEEKPTDRDRETYELARVIGVGVKGSIGGTNIKIKYILFADTITKMPYKEAHRSAYKGRWWREGLYELLFDCQVRACQIGAQIARGLDYASTLVLTDKDKATIQNITTDIKSGDFLKSNDLHQVDLRMHAFDQLIGDWNRNLQVANDLANSREIVTGEAVPNQPFRLGALLNQNANKLFDFLREKLTIPFSELFEEEIVPDLVKKLKSQDILKLTGDSSMMERLYQLVVDNWYLENLIAIGPHDQAMAEMLKGEKIAELKKRPALMVTALEEVWEGFKPHVSVVITGENTLKDTKLQSLQTFIALEQDPLRRQALIEEAMRLTGIDAAGLPKLPPQQLQPQVPPTPPQPLPV